MRWLGSNLQTAAPALLAALALAGCATTAESPTEATVEAPVDESARLLRLADATLAGGDLVNAMLFYRRAHEADPTAPLPLLGLGQTLNRSGAHADAVHAYREALALDLADPREARLGLGGSLIGLGEAEEALVLYEALRHDHPREFRAHNGHGIALDLLGRHAEAQSSYRAGLAIAPDNVSLRNNLGLSLALGGEHEAAISLLTEVASEPRATAKTRQNLALALGLAGDEEAAEKIASLDLPHDQVAANIAFYNALGARDDGQNGTGATESKTAEIIRPKPTPSATTVADAPSATPHPIEQPATAQVAAVDAATIESPTAPIDLTKTDPEPAEGRTAEHAAPSEPAAPPELAAPRAAPAAAAEPPAMVKPLVEPDPAPEHGPLGQPQFDLARFDLGMPAAPSMPARPALIAATDGDANAPTAGTSEASSVLLAFGRLSDAMPEAMRASGAGDVLAKSESVAPEPDRARRSSGFASRLALAMPQPALRANLTNVSWRFPETATTPAAAPAAAPAEAAEPYQLQVGALRSETAATASWQEVSAKAPDLVSDLAPVIVAADLGPEKGIFYRVRSTPLASKAEAEQRCGDLRARGVDCFVVKAEG